MRYLSIRIVVLLLVTCWPKTYAQNGIDTIISSVLTNNKTLKATQKYWEARKLEYRIGLNPSNPFVEYDYMIGTPATAGNQTDFTVAQSIDFPTAYIKKRQLADIQESMGEYQYARTRQEILLEAKKLGFQVIYLNKKIALLSYRYNVADSLHKSYRIKMERGDGNILDVNKAKVQALNSSSELKLVEGERNQVLSRLAALNGGITLNITDTSYPAQQNIPPFETLESTIESTDPILKSFQLQKQINDKQVEVNKALALPTFETGYHSQAILGQSFKGAHFGISIPLWEHRNAVKYSKVQALLSDFQTEEHKTEHYFEIKRLYERYSSLQSSLDEYSETLTSMNTDYLLTKALQAGHISTIEYFLELSFYNETLDRYLEIENEYQTAVAELFKYTL